ATELAPFALERDEKHIFPKESLHRAGELGLGGLYISEDHGGTGLNRVDTVAIFEALAYADPAVAAYISIHNMVAGMISAYGTAEQRDQWLPMLISMQG